MYFLLGIFLFDLLFDTRSTAHELSPRKITIYPYATAYLLGL